MESVESDLEGNAMISVIHAVLGKEKSLKAHTNFIFTSISYFIWGNKSFIIKAW